jgi:lysophospholipase
MPGLDHAGLVYALIPPVTHHQDRTIEAADGTPLHVELWEPKGEVRFVVVIVHGGAEHVGRYDRLARMFGARGGLCFGPDHRGQGKSGGRKGHVKAFEDYAGDLRRVMETVAKERPAAQRPDAIPWFAFGHSMGGLITLTYLLERAGKADESLPLRGAVISSPLIEVAVKVNPIKRLLGEVMSVLWPTLSLPTGIPANAICRDAAEVERYDKDPRRVRTITAGWYGALKRATARVRADVTKIEVPCLWYVGTGDTICSHQATLDVFRSVRALPDPEARGHELHVFDGYYHELHNEPEELRAPVMELVAGWVRQQAGL